MLSDVNSFSLTVIGTDGNLVRKLSHERPTAVEGVSVASSTVESQPGVSETISVLTWILTFTVGVSAQVFGAWIYDRWVKKKPETVRFEIYLNGKKLDKSSQEAIARSLEEVLSQRSKDTG